MIEKIYTTFQTAKFCGVQPATIIKWANQKKIKTFTTPGGHRRVRHSDLLNFLQQYRFPVPEGWETAHKKILIIEDDPAVGRMLLKALEELDAGLQIKWIKDGIEALLALRSFSPDLIVLDVVIPLIDGSKLLATLRADPKTKNIKVIGMTGARLPGERLKFVRKYSNDFFLKPFDLNEITRSCLTLLNGPQTETPAGILKKKARLHHS